MLPDLGLAIPELVGICGWIIILLAICQVDTLKTNHTDETGFFWSPAFILALAALFRAMFLWRVPELSDDIYRYLFDGLMTVSGNNPYLDAPLNIRTATPQMAELVPMINHAHLATIYPPAAQLVFAAGALIAKISGISALAGMKLLLVIMDLITCAIIINILMILNLSKKRAILYAWHPLPVIEIAASGHVDAAAVFFLMAAVALVIVIRSAKQQGRDPNHLQTSVVMILAGIFMAFAILTKWLPVVFLPGLWLTIKSGFRRYFIYGCLAAAGLLTWPFLPEFIHGLQTLSTYLQNWEFSGFAFRQLRQMTGAGETARLILAAGFILITGLACGQLLWEKTYRQMLRCFLTIAFAYLILTPTLHPWYAIYLTVFLPFAAGSALTSAGLTLAGLTLASLTLSWAVFLAYQVLILYRLQGVWIEDDFTALLIVLAPAVSFLSFMGFRFISVLRAHIDHRKTPVVTC